MLSYYPEPTYLDGNVEELFSFLEPILEESTLYDDLGPEPIGCTLEAEYFSRFFGDQFSNVIDVQSSGYHSTFEGGSWTCVQFLSVYESNNGEFSITNVTLHADGETLTCDYPQVFGSWSKPTPRELSWVSTFVDSIASGVDFQSESDVPAEFQGFARIVQSLAGGVVPDDTDPTLASEARASLRELESSKYDFLTCFRWSVKNYQTFSKSPLFKHFSNLLGIAISLGFAPAELTDFHINSIKIWRLSEKQRFQDVSSIVDGIVMALNYFVESVVASWEQGNLLPFLYERTTSSLLDTTYEDLSYLIPKVHDGSFYKDGGAWSEIMLRLERAGVMYNSAVDCAPPGSFQRKVFHERLLRIKQWTFDMTIARKGGDIVKQPFGCVIHGRPKSGKSGVCLDLQKIQAALHGVTYTAMQTASVEPGEPYHSQMFNYTLFATFDDVANRKLKYDSSCGPASMLQMINNKAFVAIKAELELKGRVMPDLLGVYATTNYRDLMVSAISNEPDSFYRRYYLIDIVVRPEYASGLGGICSTLFNRNPKYLTFAGSKYSDLQLFTINAAQESGGHTVLHRKDAFGREIPLKDLNVKQFYHWMQILMKEHHKEQVEHVERTNSRAFVKCEKCEFVDCQCVKNITSPPTIINQNAITDAIIKSASKSLETALYERLTGLWFIGGMAKYFLPAPYVASLVTSEFISFVSVQDWTQWWYYIPDPLWEAWKPFFRRICPVMKDVEIRRQIYRWRKCNVFGIFLIVVSLFRLWYGMNYAAVVAFVLGVSLVAYAGTKIATLHLCAFESITRKKTLLADLGAISRSKWSPEMQILYARVRMLMGTIAFIGAGAFVYKLFADGGKDDDEKPPEPKKPEAKLSVTQQLKDKEKRSVPESDQNAVPDTTEDVEDQNFLQVSDEEMKKKETTINQWEQRMAKYVSDYENDGMTAPQLNKKVGKGISTVDVQLDGKWVFKCNALWIATDYCLLTKHDFPKGPERWRITDNNKRSSSNIVTVCPSDYLSYSGGGVGIAHIVHRSKANLVPYLCTTPTSLSAYFLHRSENRELDDPIPVTGQLTHDATTGVVNIHWRWPQDTYKGACGGVYVSSGANPAILGVHYGCLSTDIRVGVSFLPSQADISTAMQAFSKKKSVLTVTNEPKEWNPPINGGVPFVVQEEPPNSILEQAEWLAENEIIHQGAVYQGHRPLQAFYKSRCVPTILAEDIKESFDVGDYGPPRLGRSMWPKSARYSVNSSPGLPRDDLEWAVQDYLSAFTPFPKYLTEHLVPLTRDEMLNGKDGVRFIDSMNWSSSMGLHFPGGKKAWSSEFLDENGHIRKMFAEEVWKEVERAEVQLKQGVRVPWIFNAVPKDEATPVEKEKVRLFLVAEIACTLLVRKYFTPVCRVLQMMTGLSECAVGMNCLSSDWEDVQQHLERFDRVFDGDYSKYDLRKPAQVSLASYRIMIEIAANGTYSADDLFIMSMISGELVRPLVNFNGDVVSLDGSTPSGIPVTVIVNGLDNSLFNRSAYKATYPNAVVGEFRQFVSHVNYGDDFINAVSYWRANFNFLTLQAYLDKYDVKITPGIKDAEGKRFVRRKDLVFLQRESSKLPELPFRVGALKEKSILKPLIAVIKPKKGFCPDAAAAINVDGCLREWVYHGEEIYEARRQKMDELLTKHNIRHMSQVVDHTYSQLLNSLQGLDSVE